MHTYPGNDPWVHTRPPTSVPQGNGPGPCPIIPAQSDLLRAGNPRRGLAGRSDLLQHSPMNPRKPMTLHRLREIYSRGEKIATLTCYDATFARVLDDAGVDVLLVGDSAGMVMGGETTTLNVTMDAMVYHTQCVARANRYAWVIADLPFGSYHESSKQALRNATRLIQAGAHMVKLEGGGWTAPAVRFLVERGIPVCGHLGFTPQSVHALGGFRIQGRDPDAAEILADQAQALVDAGAEMLVIELVPTPVGTALTKALRIPVIGIGAGSGCSGQVLVLQDMIGLTRGNVPRFVRNFMIEGGSVEDAIRRYVTDVKAGRFPDDTVHGY